jgi:putative transposase
MGLNRSSYYLAPATESEENLRLMRLIDQQFLRTPFYGSRRMAALLERSGEMVNRKRVQRLMALMGLDAVFPKPRITAAAPDARVYPRATASNYGHQIRWEGVNTVVDRDINDDSRPLQSQFR